MCTCIHVLCAFVHVCVSTYWEHILSLTTRWAWAHGAAAASPFGLLDSLALNTYQQNLQLFKTLTCGP